MNDEFQRLFPPSAFITHHSSFITTLCERQPDGLGGFTRYYEMPELIRVGAPIYLKFGLRNAPNTYPSGIHLEQAAVLSGRERVRRAAIALELLVRADSSFVTSQPGAGGLGIPVVPGTD